MSVPENQRSGGDPVFDRGREGGQPFEQRQRHRCQRPCWKRLIELKINYTFVLTVTDVDEALDVDLVDRARDDVAERPGRWRENDARLDLAAGRADR